MFALKIDESKCILCSACIDSCPSGKIINNGKSAELSDRRCVYCYHCVSICPSDAISSSLNLADEHILPLKEPSLYFDFLKTRRTIRCFLDKNVDKVLLEKIVSSASYCPSKGNVQKLSFTILTTDAVDALKKGIDAFFKRLLDITKNNFYRKLMLTLSKKDESFYYTDKFLNILREVTSSNSDKIFYGAPHVILIHGNKNEHLANEEAWIASYHISLACHAAGLGSQLNFLAPAGINKNYRLKNALGFKKQDKIFSALNVGYAKYDFKKYVYRESPSINWM